MRIAVFVFAFAATLWGVDANAAPLRLALECQSAGRTKACPAFLLGFIDETDALLSSPRANAEVVLYVTSTEVATIDRTHLRFVGKVPLAPSEIELDAELDTRADDDTQRALLRGAFLRGVAIYLGARDSSAVTVTLSAPAAEAKPAVPTTPWGLALSLSSFGNWTHSYRSFSGAGSLSVSRLTQLSRLSLRMSAGGGVTQQPPLIIDGTPVSLDVSQWSNSMAVVGAWLLDRHWAVGGGTRAWRDDPKGQYRFGFTGRMAVEWNRYQADDPRGNRLAVTYSAGYQAEGYNLRNVLGERFAHYPIHELSAAGSFRRDKVGYGLSLSIGGELLHPERRHHVSASPFIEWQLGGHVDLSLSLSVDERELPAPDEVDATDFELLSRASYAEPLSFYGGANVTIHWDRTNGMRNDRLSGL